MLFTVAFVGFGLLSLVHRNGSKSRFLIYLYLQCKSLCTPPVHTSKLSLDGCNAFCCPPQFANSKTLVFNSCKTDTDFHGNQVETTQSNYEALRLWINNIYDWLPQTKNVQFQIHTKYEQVVKGWSPSLCWTRVSIFSLLCFLCWSTFESNSSYNSAQCFMFKWYLSICGELLL